MTGPEANLNSQGVNNAQALKAAAVWSLIANSDSDRAAIYQMFHVLDEYHGLPNGMFSADEHFSGKDPSQGTELCTVVETMFSLETDLAITGDENFADRLERIAYNALPATITEDFWAHQYDQQPNQVMCSLSKRNWSTNGPESNIFGLEPHFGCCTANMHQGWPKLAASLWMATNEGGLAAIVYAPSEVSTQVHGVHVTIEEKTDYPGSIILLLLSVGPLVYALRINQSWRQEKQTGPSNDWEVFPTTPWNYALLLDPKNAVAAFKVKEYPLQYQPFNFAAPPVILAAQGRRVPEWQLENDSAGALPASPLHCKKSPCQQPAESIELIPSGAAKLRITAFPYFEE